MLTLWGARFGPVSTPLVGSNRLEILHALPGVPLFYLLSGYLLAWTEGKRAMGGEYRLASYVKRRALRLIPAYYVTIAIVLLI